MYKDARSKFPSEGVKRAFYDPEKSLISYVEARGWSNLVDV